MSDLLTIDFGVFTTKGFEKGEFLLEYRETGLADPNDIKDEELKHKLNHDGCFMCFSWSAIQKQFGTVLDS